MNVHFPQNSQYIAYIYQFGGRSKEVGSKFFPFPLWKKFRNFLRKYMRRKNFRNFLGKKFLWKFLWNFLRNFLRCANFRKNLQKNSRSYMHCPFGGRGLNPCPDGLGHFFREDQMGICLVLGGSKPLPGWFGALMQ